MTDVSPLPPVPGRGCVWMRVGRPSCTHPCPRPCVDVGRRASGGLGADRCRAVGGAGQSVICSNTRLSVAQYFTLATRLKTETKTEMLW